MENHIFRGSRAMLESVVLNNRALTLLSQNACVGVATLPIEEATPNRFGACAQL